MKYKETYCLEILNNIVKHSEVTDVVLVSASYTASGLTAIIEDCYNKQKYELTLKPIKGGVAE
jgi:hypothetical protein